MAGAKLIASLMASEDVILENISVGLLEARTVLSTVSSSDPSLELRQLCRKLLACISSPWVAKNFFVDIVVGGMTIKLCII